MVAWLDIAGSFVISALLLFTVMRTNADVSETATTAVLDLAVQRSAGNVATVLGEDLRKAGMGAPGGATGIYQADTHQVTFWADTDSADTPDTLISYYVGTTGGSVDPAGPSLYRQVKNSGSPPVNSGQPLMVGAGVLHFRFFYLDAKGDTLTAPVASLDDVREIRAEYSVGSEVIDDTTYVRSITELRVAPMNLNL